jgi:hypothetical protein
LVQVRVEKGRFVRSVDLRSHFCPFLCSTNTFPTYRVVAVICGLSVTLLQIFNLFIVLVRRHPAYQKLCTWYYSKGNSKHESYLKKAGIHKVDQMLVSALKLHSESLKLDCTCNNARKSKQIRSQKLTNYGRALFEFTKLDGVLTNIGGVAFTWRKIWNGTLFTEEGKTFMCKSLHSRLNESLANSSIRHPSFP